MHCSCTLAINWDNACASFPHFQHMPKCLCEWNRKMATKVFGARPIHFKVNQLDPDQAASVISSLFNECHAYYLQGVFCCTISASGLFCCFCCFVVSACETLFFSPLHKYLDCPDVCFPQRLQALVVTGILIQFSEHCKPDVDCCTMLIFATLMF